MHPSVNRIKVKLIKFQRYNKQYTLDDSPRVKVNVTNRTDDVDLENYVPNGEWELLEHSLLRLESHFPCCPEPYPYVSVTLK